MQQDLGAVTAIKMSNETGAGGAEEMTLLVKEIAVKHEDPVSDPYLSHKMLGGGHI